MSTTFWFELNSFYVIIIVFNSNSVVRVKKPIF